MVIFMTIYQDRLTFLNGRQGHDGSQDWMATQQDRLTSWSGAKSLTADEDLMVPRIWRPLNVPDFPLGLEPGPQLQTRA